MIMLDDCDLVIASLHGFVKAESRKPSEDACLLAQKRKMCNCKCRKVAEQAPVEILAVDNDG